MMKMRMKILNSINMNKNLLKYIPIVATIAAVIAISLMIKGCTEHKDPAKDRLEEINDSLLKTVMENSIKIDSLYNKIDSLDLISDTLINKQSIVNEYYRQEVYNILSADDRSANRKLTEVLKVSDSLLKAGFFSRTINIPNESN
jgi:hypothetical protein